MNGCLSGERKVSTGYPVIWPHITGDEFLNISSSYMLVAKCVHYLKCMLEFIEDLNFMMSITVHGTDSQIIAATYVN